MKKYAGSDPSSNSSDSKFEEKLTAFATNKEDKDIQSMLDQLTTALKATGGLVNTHVILLKDSLSGYKL